MVRAPTKSRLLSLLLAVPVVAYGVLTLVSARRGPIDDGPFLEGAPVRASVDGRDGVFLLTSMWRTTIGTRGRFVSSPLRSTVQYIDLWRFDPVEGRAVWRRRLAKDPEGVRSGFQVLGVAGGKLWYVARGLRAASLTDGRTVFDTAALFTRAPALRTTFPRRLSSLRLDTAGLHLQAADGRGWRIDPSSLTVTEEPARGPWEDAYTAQFRARNVEAEARVGLVLPAVVYPASPQAFKKANGWEAERWTGITTDARGDSMRTDDPEREGTAPLMDRYVTHEDLFGDFYFAEERLRLWTARVEGRGEVHRRLRDLRVLPRSDTYLQGGLLHDGSKLVGASRAAALMTADPPGVFVLSRTRLDDADTLVLARANVTDGATRWRSALPLSLLNAVMPGPRVLVLYGKQYRPAPDNVPRDPTSDAHELLVFVDAASGAVTQWFLDLDHTKVDPID
ncbi:MAG: hypothetical protein MUE41_01085 [Gemmatimonadaceae bacterium]|jgi:hypothetical protein|nr:hypothetical protein [Gemmatimonadaceae bacterium]